MLKVLVQGQQNESKRNEASSKLVEQKIQQFESKISDLQSQVFFKFDD